MTARVDYIESVDSAVCDKQAVSNFRAVFGRIKSLSVYISALMLTRKFYARAFRTPAGSCFLLATRKNRRGYISALARYSA